MDTQVSVEETDLKISCREARLLLNVVSIDRDTREMNEHELAACKHYANCKECTDEGLAEILGYTMSHQEAILVWAENPGPLWHRFLSPLDNVRTLHVVLAIEHVWGKYQWENSMGGHGYDIFTACQERPCQTLNHFWRSVPISSGVSGADGLIHEFPIIFDIFLGQRWSLDKLFSIQEERVDDVLKDMCEGKFTVGEGHYHSLDELMSEVSAHVEALQKVVRHTYEPLLDVSPLGTYVDMDLEVDELDDEEDEVPFLQLGND